jgi:small-conductance mechanosensitive channel
MQSSRSTTLQHVLNLLAGVLVAKVTFSVILGYRDYFPPNFSADFLRGRQAYFFGAYQWAFYTHILAGPISLFLGLILVSERFRLRYRAWHRKLGKFQGALVLLLLAPSGLWMAPYAETGAVAAVGFASLALATAACVVMGWRSAVNKRFVEHRRWMLRLFLLLCSAVILRLIGGAATVTDFGGTWIYPFAAWASWLLPLAAFELRESIRRRPRRSKGRDVAHSSRGLSLPAMEISLRKTSADISSRIISTCPSAKSAPKTRS